MEFCSTIALLKMSILSIISMDIRDHCNNNSYRKNEIARRSSPDATRNSPLKTIRGISLGGNLSIVHRDSEYEHENGLKLVSPAKNVEIPLLKSKKSILKGNSKSNALVDNSNGLSIQNGDNTTQKETSFPPGYKMRSKTFVPMRTDDLNSPLAKRLIRENEIKKLIAEGKNKLIASLKLQSTVEVTTEKSVIIDEKVAFDWIFVPEEEQEKKSQNKPNEKDKISAAKLAEEFRNDIRVQSYESKHISPFTDICKSSLYFFNFSR